MRVGECEGVMGRVRRLLCRQASMALDNNTIWKLYTKVHLALILLSQSHLL